MSDFHRSSVYDSTELDGLCRIKNDSTELENNYILFQFGKEHIQMYASYNNSSLN